MSSFALDQLMYRANFSSNGKFTDIDERAVEARKHLGDSFTVTSIRGVDDARGPQIMLADHKEKNAIVVIIDGLSIMAFLEKIDEDSSGHAARVVALRAAFSKLFTLSFAPSHYNNLLAIASGFYLPAGSVDEPTSYKNLHRIVKRIINRELVTKEVGTFTLNLMQNQGDTIRSIKYSTVQNQSTRLHALALEAGIFLDMKGAGFASSQAEHYVQSVDIIKELEDERSLVDKLTR